LETKESAGGIQIVESEPPLVCTVIAVGEAGFFANGERRPIQVQKGDTVYYSLCKGLGENHEVEVRGERFIVMQDQDLLLIER
jgi:chaperonin GroES